VNEVIERRRAHRIRVVHGGTGRPYPLVAARLAEPAWPHWHLRRRDADVVLSADVARLGDEPASTTVEVTLTDSAALERFTQRSFAATLQQGADLDVTLTLTVQPVVLEVVLTKPSGQPAANAQVEARATDNGNTLLTVPLPAAAAGSNVYRSAATSWDPALAPFGIYVGGAKRATVALDYTRPVTRLPLIEP
jgi:hypothetical protein